MLDNQLQNHVKNDIIIEELNSNTENFNRVGNEINYTESHSLKNDKIIGSQILINKPEKDYLSNYKPQGHSNIDDAEYNKQIRGNIIESTQQDFSNYHNFNLKNQAENKISQSSDLTSSIFLNDNLLSTTLLTILFQQTIQNQTSYIESLNKIIKTFTEYDERSRPV